MGESGGYRADATRGIMVGEGVLEFLCFAQRLDAEQCPRGGEGVREYIADVGGAVSGGQFYPVLRDGLRAVMQGLMDDGIRGETGV